MSSTPLRMSRTCLSPDVPLCGRSICVTSPVTTTLLPKPRRVRNIFICSGVVFCASSRMTKRVVERAAAHVRERRDLDDAALDERRGLLGVHHVEERVVERAQVRVDLLGERAGQEAERLPRLDGRTRQDDAADLLVAERVDRHRHREVRLAGAGRTDAERDGVLADGVDVALLVDGARADLAAAVRPHDVAVHLARLARGVDGDVHERLDDRRAERPPSAHDLHQFLDGGARLVHAIRLTLEDEHVAAQRERAVQALLEDLEVRVVLAGDLERQAVVVEVDDRTRRGSHGVSLPAARGPSR